jgi:hypothetical protein
MVSESLLFARRLPLPVFRAGLWRTEPGDDALFWWREKHR